MNRLGRVGAFAVAATLAASGLVPACGSEPSVEPGADASAEGGDASRANDGSVARDASKDAAKDADLADTGDTGPVGCGAQTQCTPSGANQVP